MKFLNTPLDEKLYKKLKIVAIKNDTTLEKIVNEAVRDLLKKYGEDEENV